MNGSWYVRSSGPSLSSELTYDESREAEVRIFVNTSGRGQHLVFNNAEALAVLSLLQMWEAHCPRNSIRGNRAAEEGMNDG